MFDKLEDLLLRFEDVLNELNEPSVVNDQVRFRKLMKEQNDLQPIVDAYKEYKKSKETVEESLQMLEEENEEEMRAQGGVKRSQRAHFTAGADTEDFTAAKGSQ